MAIRVHITAGNNRKAREWAEKRSEVRIETSELKKLLNIKNDKLILSIRDNTIIKSLRHGRNVIVLGDNSLAQIERMDEVLEAQGAIDNTEYRYKVRHF